MRPPKRPPIKPKPEKQTTSIVTMSAMLPGLAIIERMAEEHAEQVQSESKRERDMVRSKLPVCH